jgi:hypothetical protein
MANPSRVTLQLIAGVSNGIALAQTPAAAGNLVLAGSLTSGGVATLDAARRILVSSTGSDAARVFTVYGTNSGGAPISVTVTGVVSGAPVYTVLDFLTVTRIAVDAATAGAITAGTNGVASTPWIVDNLYSDYWALSIAVQVTGTVNYTVEHTYDDPQAALNPVAYGWVTEHGSAVPPVAWPDPTLVNASASGETKFPDNPIFAHRVTINSGTGLVAMWSMQAGIKS